MTVPSGFSYKELMTKDECAALMHFSGPCLHEKFRSTLAEHRKGVRWIVDNPLTFAIRHRVAEFCDVPIVNVEPIEVVCYEQGASYPLHGDLPWRSHTVLIYLNSGYEGGRTYFPKYDFRPEPKSGHALVWKNSSAPGKPIPEMNHCVEKLTSESKWVAVCWVQWDAVDPQLESGVNPASVA